jgi:hypothetical protein
MRLRASINPNNDSPVSVKAQEPGSGVDAGAGSTNEPPDATASSSAVPTPAASKNPPGVPESSDSNQVPLKSTVLQPSYPEHEFSTWYASAEDPLAALQLG